MRFTPVKIFLDTEFIEHDGKRELLSIALVKEDGSSYYAEVADVDIGTANDMVKRDVLPNLTGPKKDKQEIREDIIKFIGNDHPAWWGYYCLWDFILLQDLFAGFTNFPWSKYCNELMQFRAMANHVKLPKQTSRKHHALHDALWTKEAYEHVSGFYMKYIKKIAERG